MRVAKAQADAHAEPLHIALVPVVDRLLELDRAREPVGRAEERGYHAVAGGLHDVAAVGLDRAAEDRLVSLVSSSAATSPRRPAPSSRRGR
jgi:hypothetical protein